MNLKSPAAVQAGLKDRDEPIQIYAHLLKHPQRGNYLVDTGVSKKLVDRSRQGRRELADPESDAHRKTPDQ